MSSEQLRVNVTLERIGPDKSLFKIQVTPDSYAGRLQLYGAVNLLPDAMRAQFRNTCVYVWLNNAPLGAIAKTIEWYLNDQR